MRRNVVQWVEYIQSLHHREIELSLERVREVYLRMYPEGLPFKIVSLAGTNGKGSTAELLSSIFRQAGYKVGKFTSPHLISFNERFNLDGESIDDQRLLLAFDRVEYYRQDTPITFFEYGTLLAIELFAANNVDLAIMEVGLGGRLDSVNIFDADVAIVTSISIDHTSWLGNTIEAIAYEKVGIARSGKPLVLGLRKPPHNMIQYAQELGAEIQVLGQDFDCLVSDCSDSWGWKSERVTITNLPLPYAQAGVQFDNCALAIQTAMLLGAQLPVTQSDIRLGISKAEILGRCQLLSEKPYIVVDVSHNETSVQRLSEFLTKLRGSSSGRVLAVCGMLRDKEISVSLAQVSVQVDEWYVATIDNERGAKASEISTIIKQITTSPVNSFEHVEDAYDKALATLTENDSLVVFGSFHIVGDILEHVS